MCNTKHLLYKGNLYCEACLPEHAKKQDVVSLKDYDVWALNIEQFHICKKSEKELLVEAFLE